MTPGLVLCHSYTEQMLKYTTRVLAYTSIQHDSSFLKDVESLKKKLYHKKTKTELYMISGRVFFWFLCRKYYTLCIVMSPIFSIWMKQSYLCIAFTFYYNHTHEDFITFQFKKLCPSLGYSIDCIDIVCRNNSSTMIEYPDRSH